MTADMRRVYKTAWFAKAARKAQISDTALCEAIAAVAKGQADDLGGGVFKKRLGQNAYRDIILANSGEQWFFVYLFAKKDRANIDGDELIGFRKLAKSYSSLNAEQRLALIERQDLMEICHES